MIGGLAETLEKFEPCQQGGWSWVAAGICSLTRSVGFCASSACDWSNVFSIVLWLGKHGLGCGSGSNAGKGKERKQPALCSSRIPNFSCQKLCLIDRSFSGPGPQKVHCFSHCRGCTL